MINGTISENLSNFDSTIFLTMSAGDDHQPSFTQPSLLSQEVAKRYLSPTLDGSLPCALGGLFSFERGGGHPPPWEVGFLRRVLVLEFKFKYRVEF